MQRQKRQALANLDQFETLRREIKADVRKQHDLYVNNLVMLRQTPETSIGSSIVRKKTPKVFHP